MRPRDPLTPEQERELEAIDRALAGEPVEPELRELEALVLDVRATAPVPSPGFAARLEDELREGFPASGEQPARRRPARWPRTPRRRLLLPALGLLAALLVALVVVLGARESTDMAGDSSSAPAVSEQARPAGADSSRDESPSASMSRDGDGDGSVARRRESPGATAAPSSSSAARPAPAPRAARLPDLPRRLPGSPRKVQRSASIALETPAGDFDRTADAVNAVVARFGGIVASSQIGESDADGGEATYDLRIPTDRLDRALAALSKLGHVTERSQGLDDITGSFTSARENLADARAERRGLLRALERATTQAQIDSLKAQLRSVRGRIGGLKGSLAALRTRADRATVSLTIRGSGERTQTGGGGSWTPADAAGDAVRVLEVVAGVLLIGLAILVPAALLAALIALGVRLGRRRRREAALDPA